MISEMMRFCRGYHFQNAITERASVHLGPGNPKSENTQNFTFPETEKQTYQLNP